MQAFDIAQSWSSHRVDGKKNIDASNIGPSIPLFSNRGLWALPFHPRFLSRFLRFSLWLCFSFGLGFCLEQTKSIQRFATRSQDHLGSCWHRFRLWKLCFFHHFGGCIGRPEDLWLHLPETPTCQAQHPALRRLGRSFCWRLGLAIFLQCYRYDKDQLCVCVCVKRTEHIYIYTYINIISLCIYTYYIYYIIYYILYIIYYILYILYIYIILYYIILYYIILYYIILYYIILYIIYYILYIIYYILYIIYYILYIIYYILYIIYYILYNIILYIYILYYIIYFIYYILNIIYYIIYIIYYVLCII